MINFENVTKVYKNQKAALSHIHMNLPDTGMVFIVGDSGSGKTTLLNMLGLLDIPTSGRVLFNDLDITNLSKNDQDVFRNQHIGIIFQGLNLIDELNIQENIVLPTQLQQKIVSTEEIIEQLRKVNLNESITDYPKFLSGGERQRVAIVRALLKESSVIIADEPTGSLDEKNANNIMALLKDISQNRLVVIVSHQLQLAEKYGDRIIYLEKGKIIEDKVIHELPLKTVTQNNDIIHKYHLPFNVSFKFAYKWFTYKFSRMIFALMTFFLTLSSFILALTIYNFNEITAMQNGFQNENVTYVMIQKVPSPDLVMNDLMFTLTEKNELKSLFDESNIIGTLYNDGIAQTILDNGSDGVIQGYTNVSLTQVNEFGLLLVGRLPVDHSLTTEVVITNYIAYQMGWLNESNYHDDTVLQSIIDSRTLDINFIDGNDLHKYTFTIVGIIDTNYTLPDQTIENSTYQFMFENDLKFGLHTTLFFGSDMVNFIADLDQNIGNYGADKVAYQLFVTVKDDGYKKALDYQTAMGESNVWVNSKLDYSLHMIKEFKNVVLQVSLVLGIVFLLTSLISFVGFIHNMVVNKETSIRIMRSLGTRFKDMNFIFLIQDAFLAIFTTGLSTITALIAGHFINQSIATNIYVIIPLVNPTVWIPMVILIITFCFAYLITFTELKRTYSKTKVIE